MPLTSNFRVVPANDLTDTAFKTGTAKSQICSSCRVGFIYTRQVQIASRWFVVGVCGQCGHVEPRCLNGRDLVAISGTQFPGLTPIGSDKVGASLKRTLFLMDAPSEAIPA